jgi:hypothetical protein
MLYAQTPSPFRNDAGKYGFKDSKGKVVIAPKYDLASGFYEGLAVINMGGSSGYFGYIDTAGKEIVSPTKYTLADVLSQGRGRVRFNGEYGFIDSKGNEVIPAKYDYATNFRAALTAVRLNDAYGFINQSGKEVIPFRYHYAGYSYDGMTVVKLGEKYGFVNCNTGAETVAPVYELANDFHEGLAAVNTGGKAKLLGGVTGGKWGYIDTTGQTAISLQFDTAGNFYKGRARVTQNGRDFIIDRAGNEIKE